MADNETTTCKICKGTGSFRPTPATPSGPCVIYRKGQWTQTDHKFKPLEVTTTLNDGRKLDWSQCPKCGQLMSEEGF